MLPASWTWPWANTSLSALQRAGADVAVDHADGAQRQREQPRAMGGGGGTTHTRRDGAAAAHGNVILTQRRARRAGGLPPCRGATTGAAEAGGHGATAPRQVRIEPATRSKRNSRHSMGPFHIGTRRDSLQAHRARQPGIRAQHPGRPGLVGRAVEHASSARPGAGRSPPASRGPRPTDGARPAGPPCRAPGCARRTGRLSISVPARRAAAAAPGRSRASPPLNVIAQPRRRARRCGARSRPSGTRCRWRRSAPGSRAPRLGAVRLLPVRGAVGERPQPLDAKRRSEPGAMPQAICAASMAIVPIRSTGRATRRRPRACRASRRQPTSPRRASPSAARRPCRRQPP